MREAVAAGGAPRRVRLLLAEDRTPQAGGSPLPAPPAEPLPVALARAPVSRTDRFLFHKTTHRATYRSRRVERPDVFDVLPAAVAVPDTRVRPTAIQALRDLGDEPALPLLNAALEDPEWMIREWAARGLESITGSRHRYRNQKGEQVHPYDLYR